MGLCALMSVAAQAQSFPSRHITIVVPFAAGSGSDTAARIVAQHLGPALNANVIVENKVGATGALAAATVARSAPDGHTLLLATNSTHGSNPSLFKNLPYDPVRDFQAITLTAWGTLALVAHPKQQMRTVEEFVALAKRAPSPLAYGSPGVGTPHHLAMEFLQSETGITLMHVPYKGSAGAVQDLLGGQIGFMFLPVHVAATYVKSGRLDALAVGSAARSAVLPEVPTLIEQGVKDANIDMWYGLFAPKGTDDAVVARLNAEAVAILKSEEARSSFAKQGLVAAHSTPDEFAQLVAQDNDRWRKLIQSRGISAEMTGQADR
jgi:tripartite-type tricarboxylate transporter receptor subunit TctC